jgi:WD40 repeat protein
MWHLPSGNVMNVFSGGHSEGVSCGMFSHDGKHLVTGSLDGSLCMWDPKNSAAPIWKLTAQDMRWHTAAVTTLDISTDNALIVTGSEDGTTRLVNAQNGKMTGALEGHSDTIEAVNFCPRSVQLFCSFADASI